MTDWACEAYGDDGVAVGALCFLSAGSGERVCESREACHAALVSERQRVFRAINERAAGGDEVMAYLADEFADPSRLLGGPEE